MKKVITAVSLTLLIALSLVFSSPVAADQSNHISSGYGYMIGE